MSTITTESSQSRSRFPHCPMSSPQMVRRRSTGWCLSPPLTPDSVSFVLQLPALFTNSDVSLSLMLEDPCTTTYRGILYAARLSSFALGIVILYIRPVPSRRLPRLSRDSGHSRIHYRCHLPDIVNYWPEVPLRTVCYCCEPCKASHTETRESVICPASLEMPSQSFCMSSNATFSHAD